MVGPTSRPDPRVDQLFERRGRFGSQYRRMRGQDQVTPEMFDEPLRSYYLENREVLDLDILNVEEIQPLQRTDSQKYRNQFLLATAWSNAMGAVGPSGPQGPPEVDDFPRQRRMGRAPQLQLKDPVKTAK